MPSGLLRILRIFAAKKYCRANQGLISSSRPTRTKLSKARTAFEGMKNQAKG
jgi:hypothetical protein